MVDGYADLIDWYDDGIPIDDWDNDFDDFDDYFKKVTQDLTPINYGNWDSDNRDTFKVDLKAKYLENISPLKRNIFKFKDIFKTAGKKFGITREKTITKIVEKSQSGKKLNKTESKERLKAVQFLSRDIQNKSNLSRTESLKRAWTEVKNNG